MARTQALDYERKSAAIAVGAARLFAKHGFAQSSVTMIAEECGISKSLIFHYHTKKEDILFAVMEAHMEQLMQTANTTLYEAFDAKDRFREFSKQLLKRYSGASDSQKVLLYELDKLGKAQRDQIVGKQRVLIDFASSLLSEAVGSKRVPKDKLRTQVMLYFGMINWSHTWFRPNNGLSRNELAIRAADTTTGALR